jgi:hypothetical protein
VIEDPSVPQQASLLTPYHSTTKAILPRIRLKAPRVHFADKIIKLLSSIVTRIDMTEKKL